MQTIVDAFLLHAEATPTRVALRTMQGDALTWGAWRQEALLAAAALQRAGVMPGDRVAVLAPNSMVWPIVDLGILLAGGISVGLYPTSSPEQVHAVIADCGARVLVLDGEDQVAKVRAVRDALPAELRLVSWHADAGDIESWAHFTAAAPPAALATRGPDDDAVLIYTSGSTGTPKGARISHACLVASAQSIVQVLGLTSADTSVSFLPYCHAAERMFGHATRIWLGMEAMLVEDAAQVFEAAAAYQPTLFGGLPRFYEKAYEAMRAAESGGEPETAPARIAAARARLFGARVRRATSGGAALPVGVADYLNTHGLRVLGAYGQTEHLCVAMHRPTRFNFTSVGPAMPGTTLRIAEDGEVLVRRSALTFSGYWGREAETADAFTADGEWLLTGDLGSIDAEGFLTITGRKKELIALSNGKKVAPLPIEAALSAGTWIEHAMLHGEGHAYVTAIVTLRASALAGWAAREQASGPPSQWGRDPRVIAFVQAEIDAVNATLSRPEQIKRWAVAPGAFTVQGGELTPTMKLVRRVVAAKHATLLDSLHS